MSLPLAATITKLNITSNALRPAGGVRNVGQWSAADGELQPDTQSRNNVKPDLGVEKAEVAVPVENPANELGNGPETKLDDYRTTVNPTSWMSWFSRAEYVKAGNTSRLPTGSVGEDADKAVTDRPQSTLIQASNGTPTSPLQRRNSEPLSVSPKVQEQPQFRSWLALWSRMTTKTNENLSASATEVANNISGHQEQQQPQHQMPGQHNTTSESRPRSGPAIPSTSYGWGFWSKDQSNIDGGKKHSASNAGELAIAGRPSEFVSGNAGNDDLENIPNKVEKRQKTQSLDLSGLPRNLRNTNTEIKKDAAVEAIAAASNDSTDAGTKTKRVPENLVLPPLKRTYRTVARPGLREHLSRLMQWGSQSKPKHVDLVPTPPQIKKALAIVSLSNLYIIIDTSR